MGDRAEIRGAGAGTDTVLELELEVSAMSMIQSAILGVDRLPSYHSVVPDKLSQHQVQCLPIRRKKSMRTFPR
jgi:hypothetical protein